METISVRNVWSISQKDHLASGSAARVVSIYDHHAGKIGKVVRAVVCSQFGPPELLSLAELPDPTPGPGEVLIDVEACGINYPDFLIVQDRYQFKPTLPFCPGSEVVGRVSALGSGVDGLLVGERVLAHMTWGGLAKRAIALQTVVIPISEDVEATTAAALPFAYGTALHALKDRARLNQGETVLVLGAAGGVGLAAVQLARLLGARVIAAASSAAKLELALANGADVGVNYVNDDLRSRLKEITAGRGVDVVVDPVGGRYSELALRSLAWDGRFLVVGFADGVVPSIALNLPLLKGASIVGVFWGRFASLQPERHRENIQQLIAWHEAAETKYSPPDEAMQVGAQDHGSRNGGPFWCPRGDLNSLNHMLAAQ